MLTSSLAGTTLAPFRVNFQHFVRCSTSAAASTTSTSEVSSTAAKEHFQSKQSRATNVNERPFMLFKTPHYMYKPLSLSQRMATYFSSNYYKKKFESQYTDAGFRDGASTVSSVFCLFTFVRSILFKCNYYNLL